MIVPLEWRPRVPKWRPRATGQNLWEDVLSGLIKSDRIYRRDSIDRSGEPSQISAPMPLPSSNTPTYIVQKAKRPRGLCGSISQWLWTGWRGTAIEGTRSPHLAQKSYQINPGDCKTCREHHITCDHARPQCSHCWSQQLLCFYVEPKPKRHRKTKSTVSQIETVSTQILAKDATA